MEWKDVTSLFLEQRKKIAEWLEGEMKYNQDYCRSSLESWVANNPDSKFVFVTALATQTTVDFTTLCGTLVTDMGKIGEGAQRGGWGWGADALRVLNLLPAARLGSYINIKRLATVAQDVQQPYCTWVAVTQALNLSKGGKLYASVEQFAKALGLDSSIAGGTFAHEFAAILGNIGAKFRLFPAQKSLADIISFIKARPNGVFVFAMDTGVGSHTITGFWDGVRQCVVFVGRQGKLAATGDNLATVAQEFKVAGKGGQVAATTTQLKAATPAGQMLFIEGGRFAPAVGPLQQVLVPLRFWELKGDDVRKMVREVLNTKK